MRRYMRLKKHLTSFQIIIMGFAGVILAGAFLLMLPCSMPGGLSRQCPNHYAFHAGQNLPDKEFRYLRTVIVTAAVYWGLSSHLRLR